MPQNNNGNDYSLILVFAFFTGALFIAVAFLYALLLFFAVLVTFLCLCAWNDDLTAGNFILPREEARAFIVRGILCAIIVPAFALFCALLFGFRIPGEAWAHFVLGGYAFGSLGVVLIAVSEGDASAAPVREIPAPPPAPKLAPQGFIPQQPAPFRFASWDDEEKRP